MFKYSIDKKKYAFAFCLKSSTKQFSIENLSNLYLE